MFEKDSSGNWNTIHATNGYVGKDGVGQASESWSATPAGTYTFTMAFGILPNPGTSLNYLKVNNSHYWVGDVNSSYYNKLVSKDEVPTGWDPEQSEHLIDYSPDYNYSLVFDYNSACVPGEGSCFFLLFKTGSSKIPKRQKNIQAEGFKRRANNAFYGVFNRHKCSFLHLA